MYLPNMVSSVNQTLENKWLIGNPLKKRAEKFDESSITQPTIGQLLTVDTFVHYGSLEAAKL